MMDIIPQLAVQDVAGAEAMLEAVFGFVRQDGIMVLGNQRIAVIRSETPCGHGGIDHLALKVNDTDAALKQFMARGAVLDATTPDGPLEIAEFWDNGVRYAFLAGPEGARIELCARRAAPEMPGLPGHDHIGIPCSDIDATEGFLRSLGLTPVARFELIRSEGTIPVRFLSAGESVVELYGPPGHDGAALSQSPLWRGLRLIGCGKSGTVVGPDGLTVILS